MSSMPVTPKIYPVILSGGAGKRILIGVMIGVAFYVLNRVINQMGIIYDITPVISAGLPSLLVIAISFVLIKRIR